MRTFYICDAEKNVGCTKTSCVHNPDALYWDCDRTSNVDYAKRDKKGRPIIAKEYTRFKPWNEFPMLSRVSLIASLVSLVAALIALLLTR